MTAKELIEHLTKLRPDAEVVVYANCGPESIKSVTQNGCGEVVLGGNGGVCEHILDGQCQHFSPSPRGRGESAAAALPCFLPPCGRASATPTNI